MQSSSTTFRVVLAADVVVKLATTALLVFAALHPDWPQFAGKAMAARAVAYPLGLLVLPVVWWVVRRRSGRRYPALPDLLVSIPFLVDTAGNALDLYDAVSWFDAACHLVNWALLLGGLAVSLPRWLHPWTRLGLTVGLGSTTALLWEVGEYYAFLRNSPELATAYTDTLGDMVLGTTGSLLAGLLVLRLRPSHVPTRTAVPQWSPLSER
ncbi:hypothetical protein SAMN05660662_3544 [Blastococcus aurantiacus]|uniref:DUF2238 domain-containing protein n=1 Tax=Blastococcus aurantiacus TaxID=1550231 RepID=A0A1G7PA50_9ACTN|nr:hypothetical protein [Blastococcus aurantiacus]SDF82997.1 hypothetical protein SAMN05660662_3544 [Blastococcus aurantiacus]